MSQQEMEARALRQADGMRNAYPRSNGQQDACNLWAGVGCPMPEAPPPSLLERVLAWLGKQKP